MRKTEIRTTQKRDVIYIISNEEYLNRWRDKEDQLQCSLQAPDFD